MEQIIFDRLKIRRISEIIENHIRSLILEGEIRPGQRLPSEKELGRQFGVSNASVREALRGLEAFGLIEKRPGKKGGIFVTEAGSDSLKTALHAFLSSKKVTYREITEKRLLLEPVSIKIAASKITPDEITQLEENVAYCEKVLEEAGSAFSEKDFLAIEAKNKEFHLLLAHATRNLLLTLTVDCELDILLEIKRRIFASDINFSIQGVRGHRKILTQLEKGNVEGAKKEMALHIRGLQEHLANAGVRIDESKV